MKNPGCEWLFFFPNGSTAPWGPMQPNFSRLHDHTFRHTTIGRTPLDEGPARRRDLYLTTHNTHNRQTSMPPAGFEPIIPVSERPQTRALDRAATGIGLSMVMHEYFKLHWHFHVLLIQQVQCTRLSLVYTQVTMGEQGFFLYERHRPLL
jgi:hypothetical protein